VPAGGGDSGGLKAVAVFWAVVLAAAAAGAGYLEYLGPPTPAEAAAPVHVTLAPAPSPALLPAPAPLAAPALLPAATPAPAATQTVQTGPAEIIDDNTIAGGASGGVTATDLAQADLPRGAPIPGALPALLKPSAINPHWLVPHVAANGLAPMQAYAASQFPSQDAAQLPPDVPRVAILVAGLGDDPALDNIAAALPPEISLAFSPYGKEAAAAAAQARKSGHESLLVLPMPGLLAGTPPRQNQSTLDWSMAQFQGYAGVTDAFSLAMGGGFLLNAAARTWLMTQIAQRGLFYIEGDSDAGPLATLSGRVADDTIDASDGGQAEAVALAGVITDAQSHHAALAVLLNPTPDALRNLDLWATTLVNQDVLLVPVSALVQPPDLPQQNTPTSIDASLKQ
jgi:polysaccharide deacetylase 2 family uncharacterized protein YibQ